MFLEPQVSLLRGINVGRANRIGMADLRAVYERLGCRDVSTYVQSGNVILVSAETPDELSPRVEIALELEHGLKVRILGRRHAELASVVAGDPYPVALPTEHHVVFLSGPIPADRLAALSRFATAGETFSAIDRELHLMLPNGLGQSKLAQALTERHLGVVATARNWRTVSQLFELSRARGQWPPDRGRPASVVRTPVAKDGLAGVGIDEAVHVARRLLGRR